MQRVRQTKEDSLSLLLWVKIRQKLKTVLYIEYYYFLEKNELPNSQFILIFVLSFSGWHFYIFWFPVKALLVTYSVFVLSLGFGHMTPDTWLGQLLTVFYGLAGLPISMLALKTLGELTVSCVGSLVLRIEKRLLKVKDARRIRQKTFLATCVLMVLFLLLASVINIVAEGWSFVEGLYTWFIVMSTIGLGDYIPLQSLDQKSQRGGDQELLWVFIILLAFYILVGLCVVSAVLTSLVQAAEEYKARARAGGKLAQFIKKQTARVPRSSACLINHDIALEENRHSNALVSPQNFRRVRSNSF